MVCMLALVSFKSTAVFSPLALRLRVARLELRIAVFPAVVHNGTGLAASVGRGREPFSRRRFVPAELVPNVMATAFATATLPPRVAHAHTRACPLRPSCFSDYVTVSNLLSLQSC